MNKKYKYKVGEKVFINGKSVTIHSRHEKSLKEFPTYTLKEGEGKFIFSTPEEQLYKKPYPRWVCLDCGWKYGKVPEGHCYTVHEDVCGVCGETKGCTEPRDFRYPNFGEEYEK